MDNAIKLLFLLSISMATTVVFETKSKVANRGRITDRYGVERAFVITNGKFIDLPSGRYSLRVEPLDIKDKAYNSTGVFFEVATEDIKHVAYEGV